MAKSSKGNANQTEANLAGEAECQSGHDHVVHGHAHGTAVKSDLPRSAAELSALENELNSREIAIIEREIKSLRLQEELDRLRPLSGLYRVVKAMATERRLDSLLDTITRETQSIVKCDRCSVFVLDHDKNELWTQVAQGLTGVRTIRIPLSGAAIVSHCARAGRIINIPDAYKDDRFDPAVDKKTGYKTRSVLCVPMRNREGGIIGVFQVLNKLSGPFTSEDEEWLEALTAVASGLIEQAQAYDEIERFVDKTLEVLAQTIDKRDPLTAGHSVRVTNYSMMIGGSMDVLGEDLDILRYSAMMHDYGKIGVPEAVLWKPGRLTPEEYATVQKHASITFDLLSNLPFTKRLQAVPFVASCHHEKLDGTGYYRGLKGEQIPFLSRIIAVADVFDALTSVRHYRNRMPIEKVSEILDAGKDNHFDAACVEAFEKLPAETVLTCMESERDRNASADIGMFNQITWKRLVELTAGSRPKRGEENLKESFERLYNFGLPADYKPLD
ncbi:MAG: GAF domain-containing protein [Cyanobacteria bacterium SZAS LIN-2]|nr:GAF domain-containing protein [Cyanobacteria bacterium SZAS LIN-3]MBS1996731.1 GAF domain-containing protein [Cyanobacteria bacterium SZAS LIN-2]MBS2009590.1 GAF domain-containing protein [Cyanobacteria bacterium SZAS TMP-1]